MKRDALKLVLLAIAYVGCLAVASAADASSQLQEDAEQPRRELLKKKKIPIVPLQPRRYYPGYGWKAKWDSDKDSYYDDDGYYGKKPYYYRDGGRGGYRGYRDDDDGKFKFGWGKRYYDGRNRHGKKGYGKGGKGGRGKYYNEDDTWLDRKAKGGYQIGKVHYTSPTESTPNDPYLTRGIFSPKEKLYYYPAYKAFKPFPINPIYTSKHGEWQPAYIHIGKGSPVAPFYGGNWLQYRKEFWDYPGSPFDKHELRMSKMGDSYEDSKQYRDKYQPYQNVRNSAPEFYDYSYKTDFHKLIGEKNFKGPGPFYSRDDGFTVTFRSGDEDYECVIPYGDAYNPIAYKRCAAFISQHSDIAKPDNYPKGYKLYLPAYWNPGEWKQPYFKKYPAYYYAAYHSGKNFNGAKIRQASRLGYGVDGKHFRREYYKHKIGVMKPHEIYDDWEQYGDDAYLYGSGTKPWENYYKQKRGYRPGYGGFRPGYSHGGFRPGYGYKRTYFVEDKYGLDKYYDMYKPGYHASPFGWKYLPAYYKGTFADDKFYLGQSAFLNPGYKKTGWLPAYRFYIPDSKPWAAYLQKHPTDLPSLHERDEKIRRWGPYAYPGYTMYSPGYYAFKTYPKYTPGYKGWGKKVKFAGRDGRWEQIQPAEWGPKYNDIAIKKAAFRRRGRPSSMYY